MATACITQVIFGFEPKGKLVIAAFDMPDTSTDGGAILLKGLEYPAPTDQAPGRVLRRSPPARQSPAPGP